MSTPHIPNLNTLLSSRQSGRGRGLSRGRGLRGPSALADNGNSDSAVQRTDMDASGSRLSVVAAGYLADDFAQLFYQGSDIPKRMPIINRGTYVRTTAIDRLVNNFLSGPPNVLKQIVSLGAGTDTRYFRLAASNPSLSLVYHEIDFPVNTAAKISTIKQTPSLLSILSAHSGDPDSILVAANGESLKSPRLNIHAIDLRTISPSSIPNIPNLQQEAPTLILSECCLIYLSPEHNYQILSAFTEHILPAPAPLALVMYEPIRPNDAFGRTMVANLASRGIHLQTLQNFENLAAQRSRLKSYGFAAGQNAADTEYLWRRWVSEEEKVRVANCEMLDEIEEWVLLARHYCVVWGFREPQGGGVFEAAWANLDAQQDE